MAFFKKNKKNYAKQVDLCYNQNTQRKRSVIVGSYSALDVAKCIISYCNLHNKSITNLKLQKLLYFVWIEYYKSKKEILFSDSIYAWKFGPVVQSVYDEYKLYGNANIFDVTNADIDFEDKIFIEGCIIDLVDMTAFELVDKSHNRDGAWYSIFNEGKGDRFLIPFSLIEDKLQ